MKLLKFFITSEEHDVYLNPKTICSVEVNQDDDVVMNLTSGDFYHLTSSEWDLISKRLEIEIIEI